MRWMSWWCASSKRWFRRVDVAPADIGRTFNEIESFHFYFLWEDDPC